MLTNNPDQQTFFSIYFKLTKTNFVFQMGNRTSLKKRENIEKKKKPQKCFKVDNSNLVTVIYTIKADLYSNCRREQKMNKILENSRNHINIYSNYISH